MPLHRMRADATKMHRRFHVKSRVNRDAKIHSAPQLIAIGERKTNVVSTSLKQVERCPSLVKPIILSSKHSKSNLEHLLTRNR
jgi:hypothetical protein